MTARLPAHLEVSALIRLCESEGGFAAVIRKGERDAGTIIVVLARSDGTSGIYERMPQLDGTRAWTLSKTQTAENKKEIDEYLERRARQDDDLWIVELAIDEGERLILKS
ncbi:DUF1491 family protein [Novosphingobium sp. ZN18A2]|uniref:DUF1491 family protein n=1 Tax=Novosphingobium sp. ZN18A2 TaxID=3079861 RepID=UPI0030D4EBEA